MLVRDKVNFENIIKFTKRGDDQFILNQKFIDQQLPCNKCDGDCCGIVPFEEEQILNIFSKYSKDKEFKKRFPYSNEKSFNKNIQFSRPTLGDVERVVVTFKDSNKYRKLGFSKTTCIFKKDSKIGGCLIYEDRPLVCRVYGHTEILNCPYRGLDKQPDEGIEKTILINQNLHNMHTNVEARSILFNKS